jgi:hypothetical protein
METERLAVSPSELAEPVTNRNGKPVCILFSFNVMTLFYLMFNF